VLSAAGEDWHGRRGLVHRAALDDHPSIASFDVYASGPPVMVEAIRSEFVAAGLPPEQLFFDSFDYAPDALAKLNAGLPPRP
jgi:CDP-4-dehydro-6-deoxyglucose reductase